jgi:uncharacterized membrane protein
MKTLIRYFFQGLVFIAPIFVTIYIVVLLFGVVDGLLQNLIYDYLGMRLPGLGVLIVAGVLITTGVLTRTLVARTLMNAMNRLFQHIPVLNILYSSFRDLFTALVGDERKFERPVLVLMNRETGLQKIGFLTEDKLIDPALENHVAVYFPHSYNFSGEMFIVPAEHVRILNMPPGEVMKFIVSGGVAGAPKSGSV